MRRNNEKTWMEPLAVATPFLDEDSAESATSVAVELRARMATVEEQMLAHFSSTAAYATLAQQAVEQARGEARADHERLQATIIGLLDRLRTEMSSRLDAVETHHPTLAAPAIAAPDVSARLTELEDRTNVLITALHAYGQESIRLRQQVDELLAEKMRSDGWLVSSGSGSDLAMR